MCVLLPLVCIERNKQTNTDSLTINTFSLSRVPNYKNQIISDKFGFEIRYIVCQIPNQWQWNCVLLGVKLRISCTLTMNFHLCFFSESAIVFQQNDLFSSIFKELSTKLDAISTNLMHQFDNCWPIGDIQHSFPIKLINSWKILIREKWCANRFFVFIGFG